MEHFALLAVAFLFGGMLSFSVGFGAMVFKHLSPDQARPFIRQTFPFFICSFFGSHNAQSHCDCRGRPLYICLRHFTLRCAPILTALIFDDQT
jgi:hypothetical protein